jgi:hypothetical protein
MCSCRKGRDSVSWSLGALQGAPRPQRYRTPSGPVKPPPLMPKLVRGPAVARVPVSIVWTADVPVAGAILATTLLNGDGNAKFSHKGQRGSRMCSPGKRNADEPSVPLHPGRFA